MSLRHGLEGSNAHLGPWTPCPVISTMQGPGQEVTMVSVRTKCKLQAYVTPSGQCRGGLSVPTVPSCPWECTTIGAELDGALGTVRARQSHPALLSVALGAP